METTLTQMASMENPVTGRRAPHAEISDLETVEVIGVKVAVLDYARAVQVILEWAEKGDRAYGVAAANTHVAALARHDRAYGAALGRFDLICPDGMPLRSPALAFLPTPALTSEAEEPERWTMPRNSWLRS